MAKRSSLVGAAGTAAAQTAVPSKPGNPAVVLDGMGKAELEELLATVSQKLKDAAGTPVTPER
jgi:hypothetical protein